MKSLLIVFVGVLMLEGCTITTHYLQDGVQVKSAVDAKNVKVYSGDLTVSYEVIGSVAVDVAGDGQKAMEQLKIKAGKIGANAIILTKLSKISSIASRTGLSGVAVFVK